MKLALLVFALGSLVGCTNSIGQSEIPGEPLSGDVSGTYGSTSFVPKYGIALPSSVPAQAELEIQFGAGGVNCEYHLQTGGGNQTGIFARVFVKKAAVGSYPATFVEFDELTSSHTSQRGSDTGNVQITVIDDAHVAGSITFQDTVNNTVLALNGSFDVKRCP